MQHTLVAVFDNRTDAQNAMNELLSSNFSRQDVHLSNSDPTGMTDSVTGASATNTDADDTGGGISSTIKNFFTDLFGADNSEHASRYEGAVTRGHHVLTVTADSLPEVERAADIVERYGPTDIDEQASGVGAMGAGAMAGMGATASTPESMRMSGAGGMQQSAGMSAQSTQSGLGQSQQLATPQLDNPGDRKLFAQQSLNQAEPMGQTYQEPQGKSGLSATGGTSLQGSTLQENSVQGSSLDGTQKSDTSFLGSGQQGGTLQGSSATNAIQTPGSGLGGDPVGSPSHAHLGSRQLDSGNLTGATGVSQQRDTSYQPGSSRTESLRSDAMHAAGTQSIPVVEEQLSVGKREVQRGGVRIYSRVRETPVNETVSLREEHVDVQRRPVNQPLGAGDSAAFREQSIEMRETAEEPVVEKSARIVEEVTVGKQVSERQEQIHDTVRHTEVDVQRLDGTMARSDMRDDDSYFRNHFTSTYGVSGESYDDYAPAYSYGSQMARSGRFTGRQWDQVENDLRSDWDTRNSGGPSTWEKMKAAVRQGWDRMTTDDDDSYYRSHYDTHLRDSGVDYDSAKPAYSYGAEMRKSELYRNRPWDDIEGDMRRGWDSRVNVGTGVSGDTTDTSAGTTGGAGAAVGGAWDRMKSAVRHGWERMTDDDDNDREYRSHWNATYSTESGSTYDEYKPAYSYGSEMALNEKYRGRQWNEVENDLRTDWDTRYGSGGQSTWEKMKSAVRHGWDRMTS
ncbi:DUF2382 domain-containing protein [Massilia consociata]|uniref:DUF2382 domain-containing protein n=1 Tax=Massilia consociata TaxID=760117 RepID=A0ABV6FEV0_9BURK